MKKILLLFGFFVVATTGLYAQVGIGTTDPATSAQLEVKAANKGVLIPRVGLTATNEFAPVVGAQVTSLLVYNTKTNTSVKTFEVYPGYYYWYAKRWNRVISKNDFSSKEIIKEILKNSNIVTVESNTLVYYNQSGTTNTKTVDIIKVINNESTTTKINYEKIQPGTQSGSVLTTMVDKGVTKTTWLPQNKVTLPKEKLTVKGGLKLENVTKSGVDAYELAGAVLTPITIDIEGMDISKLTVSNTTLNSKYLSVDNKRIVAKELSIDSNKITGKKSLTSDGSIVFTTGKDGSNATLKDVQISVGVVSSSKIELVGNKTPGDILVVGTGNKSITYMKPSELVKKGITTGTLTSATEGLTVSSGEGRLFGGNATITIKNLPVDNLKGGEENKGRILGVLSTGSDSGTVAWTDKLPASVTVSLTAIQGEKTTTTTTRVVILTQSGTATTTTIESLTNIGAENGVKKENNKIKLGGDLTGVTKINVKDYDFSIKGLKTTTITETTQVVVMDANDSVLKTVSATDFKGSGDYVIDGTSQETGNKLKNNKNDKTPKTEKMITVLVKVKTITTSIRSSTVENPDKLRPLGKDDNTTISEIRVFSKKAIKTTEGVERHVAFSAATLEGTGTDVIIRPGISSGGLSAPVFPGEYYIVVKYFE